MNFGIRIDIEGVCVNLALFDIKSGEVLGELKWEDKRDLSDKLFGKIVALLRKGNVSLSDVRKFYFICDSPYFSASKKEGEIKMEDKDSTGKCGFTAWQTGEIISKVMNFALDK